MSLVSVIIPTYNRRNLVQEALRSVYAQSYRPIEVVIVDDGSTDDTETVVRQWKEEYQEKDQFEVQYLSQTNQGAPAARNRGIEASTGEFSLFLDSDDRLTKDALQDLVAEIQSRDVQATYGDCIIVDEERAERTHESQAPAATRTVINMVQQAPRTSSVLIEADAIRDVRWREDLPCGQEWAFFLDLALEGSRFRHVATDVLLYRHHVDDVRINNVHSTEENVLNQVISEYILENEERLRGWGKEEHKLCDRALVRFSGLSAAKGDYSLAWRLMDRANRGSVLKQFLRGEEPLSNKDVWVPALVGATLAGWAYRINWYL